MKCPVCGKDNNVVLNCRTRRKIPDFYRRRECQSCGTRFTTKEKYCPDELDCLHKKSHRAVRKEYIDEQLHKDE